MYVVESSFWAEGSKQMELAVLIVGLLVLGSQIPGNSHIILR